MKKIVITNEQAGKRIDKFLATEFFSCSRGELARKIKNGEVMANKKNVKPSYVLQESDVLEIRNLEKKNEVIPNKDIKLDIIFEDKNIVVINKPAGTSVHPSSKEKENTIANVLVAKYPEIRTVHDESADAWMRPGIVHRLDKETSGVMVIAKNTKTLEELKRIFKHHLAQKKYVAICQGIFEDKEGIIEKPIARSSSYRKQVIAGRKTRTKVREAVTGYKVIKESEGYSYVEIVPKTGRMHQIRIHLSSIGHPIVGDAVYLKKRKRKQKDAETSKNSKRHLLHAKELRFSLFGKKYVFSSLVPEDFEKFLASMCTFGTKKY